MKHIDDKAVSSVVGAILMLGVLFAFLVQTQVNYVPVWEEDAEAAHLQRVDLQLNLLASELVAPPTGFGAGVVATPIPLVPSDLVLMGPIRMPGSIVVQPELNGIQWSAASFNVFEQNGILVGAAGNNYETISDSGTTLNDVSRLHALRLRITDLGASDVGSSFQATFNDVDGTLLGTLTGSIEAASAGVAAVSVTVSDATGNPVGARSDSVDISGGDGVYFLDTLDPSLQTTSILAAGSGITDILLSFQRDTLSAAGGLGQTALGTSRFAYAASYDQEFADGSTGSVNPGVNVQSFSRDANMARIQYQTMSQFLVSQDLIIDGAGLVVTQPNGEAVRSTPGLLVHRVGNDLDITMALPAVTSDHVAGGSDVALIKAFQTGRSSFSGYSDEIAFRMTTPYVDAWTQYWIWALQDAGIDTGYTITPSATGFSVEFTGSAVDTTADFDQITVRFANPNYRVDL